MFQFLLDWWFDLLPFKVQLVLLGLAALLIFIVVAMTWAAG
jgi:hypothetical protein